MRRTICLALAALLALLGLTGCQQKGETNPFTAQNEISTYQRIDPEKTQLVVSRTGNIAVLPFCKAFEAKNPDIQVIYLDITGGNDQVMPAVDWVEHGYLPDVMLTASRFTTDETAVQYYENLSASPVMQQYQTAALQRTATNANVYWLPGPSNINAIVYNKTLFQQYGWQVPATLDQFIDLCARIREDTQGQVEPWNPNAKYSDELQIALEAFTYEKLFSGVENRAWYNGLGEGKTLFTGHMEPYYQALQKLIDGQLLRPEHFSYSATARGKEFLAGKIAMINMVISDLDNDQFDFGYMPFPTTQGELGYVCDSYSCFLGIPKKEHTQAQRDAIDRFVAYFSSPEGQLAFIGNSVKVSNVKDVPLNQSEDLAALQPAIQAGHMFANLSLRGKSGRISIHQDAKDMAGGVKTMAQCLADNDALQKEAPAAAASQPTKTVIATAKKDFTVLETSFYLADAYREAAEADVGLIVHNAAYRGNLMRVFAGELTPDFVTVWKPRSFANDAKLVKLNMTGKQLLAALNAPADGEDGNTVYAYAGLKCQVAPWNEVGKKYLSVKLADGSALEPDKTYTVAAWAGTVAEAFATDVAQTYEGTWEEIITKKLQQDETIAPAEDGRIALVWQ